MPELPEVESVRRMLKQKILGKVFDEPRIFYPPCVKSGPGFQKGLKGREILAVDRRGKFLILRLNGGATLLVHLRMEGKLFFYEKSVGRGRYDTALFPFQEGGELRFQDVRKFGCLWFYPPGKPLLALEGLGPEADQITPPELQAALLKRSLPLKDALMDQTAMAGIGNIYAAEICFALRKNPFQRWVPEGEAEARKACEVIRDILHTAIQRGGTTVRSFLSAPGEKGDHAAFLKVYGRQGKPCPACGFPLQKRIHAQRGTTFCPVCQKVPLVVGVTGGMASGKTSFGQLLSRKVEGLFVDCDREVASMYRDAEVLKALRKASPAFFTKRGRLASKAKRARILTCDPKSRRRFLTCLYRLLYQRLERIVDSHPERSVIVEAPLLYEAHLDRLCHPVVMMETSDPIAHLLSRGEKDVEGKMALAATNPWRKHRSQAQFTFSSDEDLGQIQRNVDAFLKAMKERGATF